MSIQPQEKKMADSNLSNNNHLTTDELTGMPVLGSVFQQAQGALRDFATRPDFTDKMQLTFGEEVDVASLQETWENGSFGTLPEIEVLPASEINGANGAFAAETNTIYLSQELLTEGNSETITSVFLEEYGHYLDSQFSSREVAGDEGKMFASFVQGNELSKQELASLREEDDSATLEIDGESVKVEQATNSIQPNESALRSAINDANSGDTITFDSEGTIALSNGNLTIDKALTIDGDLDDDGTPDITVDASENPTVKQGGVFFISDSDSDNKIQVTIDGLTMQGGNVFPAEGGAIANREKLTITNSTIRDNFAANDGGGISNQAGILHLKNTTVTNNSADKDGGGILLRAPGTLTLTNSTVSNNFASRNSGGIEDEPNSNRPPSQLNLINSTVSGNSSDGSGGGISSDGNGSVAIVNSTVSDNSSNSAGGIDNNGTISLTNSIISGNEAGDSANEIRNNNGSINADANNLFGDRSQSNSDAFDDFSPGDTDIVATDGNDSTPLRDILETDEDGNPLLQDNEGQTETIALAENSPAINAGNNDEIPADQADLDGDGNTSEDIPYDQRGDGFDRVSGEAVDIGAVEVQNSVPPEQADFIVTNPQDSGEGSLRSAIAQANNNNSADIITFDSSLSGETIELSSGALGIGDPLTIEGLGKNQLTIDANGNSRVFSIDSNSVTLDGLTITGGSASTNGGGIYNSGDLTLTNSTVTGNSAPGESESQRGGGGGIYNKDTITLINSTVSDNSVTVDSRDGGGIHNIARVNLINSTISDNSAPLEGGGIYNQGIVNLTNSTISGNSAQDGGGIFQFQTAPSISIRSSTISGNSAQLGGGISTRGTINLTNSIISGNKARNSENEIYSTGDLVNADANNLFGDASQTSLDAFEGFSPGDNDIVATSDGTSPTRLDDIIETDRFGNPVLQDNGGSIKTIALAENSPAINAGDNTQIPSDILDIDEDGNPEEPISFDQRGQGFDRVVGEQVDLGATEVQNPEQQDIFFVTNTNDSGEGSLRNAIAKANLSDGKDIIDFSHNLSKDNGSEKISISLSSGRPLQITDDLVINGLGSDQLAIRELDQDSDEASRIFKIDDQNKENAIDVTISGLTINGGNNVDTGGGIFNQENLILKDTNISSNQADLSGGGISNSGNLRLIESKVSGNAADAGGAILNNGKLSLIRSTLKFNSAESGNGGGIDNNGTLKVINSGLIGNNANNGGGIYNGGSKEESQITNALILNSTIANNGDGTSPSQGDGIFNNATLTLANSIIFNPSSGGELVTNSDSAAIATTGVNLVEDGSLTGEDIIEDQPLLKATENQGLFAPTAGSPVIDTGDNTVLSESEVKLDLNGDGDTSDSENTLVENTALSESELGIDLNGDGDTKDTLDDNNNLLSESELKVDFNGDGDTQDSLETDQRGKPYNRIVNETVDLGAIEAIVFEDKSFSGIDSQQSYTITDEAGALGVGEQATVTARVTALGDAVSNTTFGILGTEEGEIISVQEMDSSGSGTINLETSVPSSAQGNELFFQADAVSTEAEARNNFDPTKESAVKVGEVSGDPGVTITETGGSTEVTEGEKRDVYEVVLDQKPTANVEITLDTVAVVRGPDGNPIDVRTDASKELNINGGINFPDIPFVSPDTTLLFTPDNWDQPQTVVVEAINDDDIENEESSDNSRRIRHQVTSDDEDYNNISGGSVSVEITDANNSTILNGEDSTIPSSRVTANELTFQESLDFIEGKKSFIFEDISVLGVDTFSPNDIGQAIIGFAAGKGTESGAAVLLGTTVASLSNPVSAAIAIGTALAVGEAGEQQFFGGLLFPEEPTLGGDTELVGGLIAPEQVQSVDSENEAQVSGSLTVEPGEELTLLATIAPGSEADRIESLSVFRIWNEENSTTGLSTEEVKIAEHSLQERSNVPETLIIDNFTFGKPNPNPPRPEEEESQTGSDFTVTNKFKLKLNTKDTKNDNTTTGTIGTVTVQENESTGTVEDGFIANGTVFIDANQDGTLNEDELSTTTAADGNFSFNFSDDQFQSLDSNGNGQLDASEGTLVLKSSSETTDLATGLPFETSLTAPANATVITPLTTLVSELLQQGQDIAQAQTTVKTAFGINEQIDPTSFDPIREANQGNPLATTVFASGARVQNAVIQIAQFLNGTSSTSVAELGNAAFSAISQQLSNDGFNLSNQSTLETIINQTVSSAGISLPSSVNSIVSEVASLIAEGQQRISNLDPSNPQSFLQQVTQIQKVSQGNVAEALQGLGSNPETAETVLSENMGDNLDTQINDAEVNNVFPPEVKDVSFTLGSDLSNGDVIGNVSASDADGDALNYSIISGNPNQDNDETSAVAISQQGQLTVADSDDLNLDNNSSLNLTVEVTEANRDANNALSDTAVVTLNTENTNNPPQQQFPLSDQTALEGTSFNFTVPEQAFTDIDADDSLSYSVSQADGSELPEWLSFNAENRTLSGTPSEEDDGSLNLQVSAEDSEGATANASFTLNVEEVNDPPQVNNSLSDQTATEKESFELQVPENTFSDSDDENLTLSASLANGDSLPDWLSFNAENRTFSGTPAEEDDGSLDIQVTAEDSEGATANASFTLNVEEVNEAPVFEQAPFTFNLNLNQADAFSKTVTATDPEQEEVNFEITEGNDPNDNGTDAFSIDNNGTITVANAEELEGQDVFNLTVQASDGEAETTADVNIDVGEDESSTNNVFDIGGNGELNQSDGLLLLGSTLNESIREGVIEGFIESANAETPDNPVVPRSVEEVINSVTNNSDQLDIGGNGELNQSDGLLLLGSTLNESIREGVLEGFIESANAETPDNPVVPRSVEEVINFIGA